MKSTQVKFRDQGYEDQSETDPYVFIGNDSIVLVHVDDYTVMFKRKSGISDSIMKSLANGKECFEFIDQRDLKSHLGVDIKMHKDRSIEVTLTPFYRTIH